MILTKRDYYLSKFKVRVKSTWNSFHLFEFSAKKGLLILPSSPSELEKYIYTNGDIRLITLVSIVSFLAITFSASRLYSIDPWLYPLYLLLGYSIIYFLISLRVNFSSKLFNVTEHKKIVNEWKPDIYPSIDIFLPTCGEPLSVLKNTWDGVKDMCEAYPGEVFVYNLDDAHSSEVRALATTLGFQYHARENKGWFKKAGNLRYGFEHSYGNFIAIFDADFRPRSDFLNELLPYFDRDSRLGIVQSPQYFQVTNDQNWLERGAGAVQEFFYRAVQTSRQNHGGAICVGSNAIYRRKALESIGGTALIEHSEDVHTGFDLRRKGWHLLYIPIVLAKGLCPAELSAFFKQQYRWCLGSMSLLKSDKFWKIDLPHRTRFCYCTGFMYYIYTAVYAVFTPFIPLLMLYVLPNDIRLSNYLFIFPSIVYTLIVFPLWHKVKYGIETSSVKLVYGWAHLFALIDTLTLSAMEWQPTGTKHTKNLKYLLFRFGVVIFNLFPAMFWVSGSLFYLVSRSFFDFLPILLLGLYYLLTVLKVVLYIEPEELKGLPQTGVLRGDRELEIGFT
jgi:cellulose synthase (UDP-forming)